MESKREMKQLRSLGISNKLTEKREEKKKGDEKQTQSTQMCTDV